MMGEAPPAFDLLYWNGDGTNLPGCMAMQYLRGLCQENQFAEGGFEISGENLQLKDVKTPLCAIACETDHIAAWDSSYHGVQQMSSNSKTFISKYFSSISLASRADRAAFLVSSLISIPSI